MIRVYLDGSATAFAQAQEAADGTFSIPLASVPAGSHTVEVTAQLAGQSESARVVQTISVVRAVPPPPPPPVTTPDPQAAGTWANVTPAGISLDPNLLVVGGQSFNYGAQEVVADPNNPGTLFAAFCYQGIWKSTDYGKPGTWTKLTNGGVLVLPSHGGVPASPDPMDNGRPAMAIAPDGSCIVATLLYPLAGFSNGCWKSSASDPGGLGAKWRRITAGAPNGDDVGAFHVDPDDPLHVIGFPHSANGKFYESHDAGETWTPQSLPAGAVVKLAFIGSGNVLAGYDWGSGVNPQLGKRSNSTWPWTWSWSATTAKDERGNTVAGQTSFHGAQQVFVDKVNGASYVGGPEGIQRSTDSGATWTKLSTPADKSEGLIATSKAIYSTSSFASAGGFQVNFQAGPRSPTATGRDWKTISIPAALTNGWVGAAVVNDGTHAIVVAGCWDAGLWRYVEP